MPEIHAYCRPLVAALKTSVRVVVLFFSKIPQKYKDISNILGHTASNNFFAIFDRG